MGFRQGARSAAVPNAQVVALHTATRVRDTAASGASGNFTIPQLPPGGYGITVEAQAFRRFTQKGIGIAILQTVSLTIGMRVGDVEQTIEITANAPAVQTATSDLGTAVSRERAVDLPLAVSGIMRHPGAFVFLAPGVTGDTSNTQINGSQNRSKEILFDGGNLTFFHFVWPGFRFPQGELNQLLTLPAAAMRAGDFSGVTRLIYDPNTTRLDGSANFIRDPFPGNRIATNRFSRVPAASLPLVPAVSNPNLTLNYQATGARTFDRDQYSLKAGHNLSDTQRFNVYICQNYQVDTAPEQIAGALPPARTTERPVLWVRVNHDSVLSPTVINSFRAGFTREPERFVRITADQGPPGQIGLTGINTGPGNVFPRVTFTDVPIGPMRPRTSASR